MIFPGAAGLEPASTLLLLTSTRGLRLGVVVGSSLTLESAFTEEVCFALALVFVSDLESESGSIFSRLCDGGAGDDEMISTEGEREGESVRFRLEIGRAHV